MALGSKSFLTIGLAVFTFYLTHSTSPANTHAWTFPYLYIPTFDGEVIFPEGENDKKEIAEYKILLTMRKWRSALTPEGSKQTKVKSLLVEVNPDGSFRFPETLRLPILPIGWWTVDAQLLAIPTGWDPEEADEMRAYGWDPVVEYARDLTIRYFYFGPEATRLNQPPNPHFVTNTLIPTLQQIDLNKPDPRLARIRPDPECAGTLGGQIATAQ